MMLICLFLCRSVSLPLFFFPPSSSAYAPILISISSIVLRLISSSLFPSRLHPLPASLPLNLALRLASAGFFMPSAYAPIFIPLRCLSLSFCILNCPYSASFPFLALQLISSRPLLYLIFHFLPVFQSRRVPPALALPLLFFFPSSSSAGLSISPGLFPLPSSSPSSFVFPIPSASSSGLSISPLLLLLLRAILLCSRCSARRKYSLFTPPPLIWLKRQFVLF